MRQFKRILIAGILISVIFPSVQHLHAQTDTLVLVNSDVIVGQIQGLNRNVLTISTPYSDADFKISWEKVRELYSPRLYTVTFSDRTLMTSATLQTVMPGLIKVDNVYTSREESMSSIVNFRPVYEDFWSKLSASADVGYSLTKANNLQQYNGSVKLGYKSNHWTLSSGYRQVTSQQDEVDAVRRVEASIEGDYALENGIFFRAGVNFLSNSEQRLLLRTIGNIGTGYYLIRRSTWHWNAFVGVAVNNENYEENSETAGSADRSSLESIFGTSLDLFDIGDFGLSTTFNWFPSYTEGGRNRIDYRIDISYDLPLNFYLKGGLTLNYDSDPVVGASDTDYIILTGFGWEL